MDTYTAARCPSDDYRITRDGTGEVRRISGKLAGVLGLPFNPGLWSAHERREAFAHGKTVLAPATFRG